MKSEKFEKACHSELVSESHGVGWYFDDGDTVVAATHTKSSLTNLKVSTLPVQMPYFEFGLESSKLDAKLNSLHAHLLGFY